VLEYQFPTRQTPKHLVIRKYHHTFNDTYQAVGSLSILRYPLTLDADRCYPRHI